MVSHLKLNLHLVQSPRGFTAPESGRGAADGAGRNDYCYENFMEGVYKDFTVYLSSTLLL